MAASKTSAVIPKKYLVDVSFKKLVRNCNFNKAGKTNKEKIVDIKTAVKILRRFLKRYLASFIFPFHNPNLLRREAVRLIFVMHLQKL